MQIRLQESTCDKSQYPLLLITEERVPEMNFGLRFVTGNSGRSWTAE